MEEALIAILLADADVAAQVGTNVHFNARPQGVRGAAITLQRISALHDYHSQGPSGFVSSRVQMDTWSTTYKGAKLASRAAIKALSGIRGDYGGVTIHGVFIEDVAEQAAADGSQLDKQPDRYFRVRVDFNIKHTES